MEARGQWMCCLYLAAPRIDLNMRPTPSTCLSTIPLLTFIDGPELLKFHIGQVIEFQRFFKRDDWSDDHVANQRCLLRLFQGRYFYFTRRVPRELQGHYPHDYKWVFENICFSLSFFCHLSVLPTPAYRRLNSSAIWG